MKSLGKITLQVVAGANIATILVMLFVGYSDRFNPVDHTLLSTIGLTFPVFLCINIAFTAFWIIFSVRRVIIPLVGFIVCYAPVRVYAPLNINKALPDSTIKVLSYNVWTFKDWTDVSEPCRILDYLIEQNADIVCLQESGTIKVKRDIINKRMATLYAYSDTVKPSGSTDEITVFSKFPIVGKENINYESKNNHSAAFRLDVHGDTVIFIANHLESIGLSSDEKKSFKSMMKGKMEKDSVRSESQKLVHKLGMASAVRAPQADAVARYIRDHKGESIILCGDFNDSPISYTRRVIADELTDCYVASGNGPGISYHISGFYVRIDNIMCSDDWKPVRCVVDSKIKASDHYPIICWLKKRSDMDK